MTSDTIKTRDQAIQLLNQLYHTLDEALCFANHFELDDIQIAKHNLLLMQNSVERSEGFFETYFENKDSQEILDWIEEEAKKW